jgi:hypothetical protein
MIIAAKWAIINEEVDDEIDTIVAANTRYNWPTETVCFA